MATVPTTSASTSGGPARSGRRALLLGLCALAVSPGAAQAVLGPRVAALDWASALNLLHLGITPIVAPEKMRYATFVVDPPLPESVVEIGLRAEPSLELLNRLKPDIVVMNEELVALEPRVAHIAPVLRFQPLARGKGIDQLTHGLTTLMMLASELGVSDRARKFEADLDAGMARARLRLKDYDGRPLYLATLLDPGRCLIFANNSLYQSVLDRLGLDNAWLGAGSAFGHLTVTLDTLTDSDARLVTIGDLALVKAALAMRLPVLSSLPAVAAARVAPIDQSLFYGGAPAALRFAEQLSIGLQKKT